MEKMFMKFYETEVYINSNLNFTIFYSFLVFT